MSSTVITVPLRAPGYGFHDSMVALVGLLNGLKWLWCHRIADKYTPRHSSTYSFLLLLIILP